MYESSLKFSGIGIKQGTEPEHSHEYYELYISLGGKAVNIINGTESIAFPGDIYVLTADTIHEQREISNYEYCIFKYDHKALLAEARLFINRSGFQQLFVLDPKFRSEGISESNLFVDRDTLEYAKQVAKILQNETDNTLKSTMFLSLASLLCIRCARREISNRWKGYNNITDSVSFMENHYSDRLNLDILAEKSHYSSRHFTRLFRECYNMSPMDYLNKIRLRHASEMLVTTSFSVTQIAQMCGFADNNLFSRRFKQYYSIAPLKFRTKYLGQSTSHKAFKSVLLIKS
jgi:AraC-like DNA-binding protein